MIAGRKGRFAIEAELAEVVEGWVLGKFRFWLCGQEVGDWGDTTDLKGCAGWLREFSSKPRDRFDADLEQASAEEVFRRVFDPVMAATAGPCLIDDAFARFHIAHLGMSSFEEFDILLLKDSSGGERCLWRRAGDLGVQECRLFPNEMESVAGEFCLLFESELGKVLPPHLRR